MEDETARTTTATTILASGRFSPWEFTREELAEVLEELLATEQVDTDLDEQARDLLKRWTQ
jgi:hypothetical protein